MSVHEDLTAGRVVAVGKGLYQKCPDCGQLVKLNKFLIGSAHLCLTEEERAAKYSRPNHRRAG